MNVKEETIANRTVSRFLFYRPQAQSNSLKLYPNLTSASTLIVVSFYFVAIICELIFH